MGQAELTGLEARQVIEIVRRLLAGEGYRSIAQSMALSENAVRNIKRGKSWARFSHNMGWRPSTTLNGEQADGL